MSVTHTTDVESIESATVVLQRALNEPAFGEEHAAAAPAL